MISRLAVFNRLALDPVLVLSILPLLFAGLVTMNSFTADRYYFDRQLIWIIISFIVFFLASLVDWRFLRRSGVVAVIYGGGLLMLLVVALVGQVTRDVQSWLTLGGVSIQPAEFMKLIMIIILAKYFSRRHIEIANIRHIILSGAYTFVPFALVALQPDFGSALIIFSIWLGMTMVSGISLKHLALVFLVGSLAFGALWGLVFADYQKERIKTFIHPLADIQGSGYNAFQSMVAVGSGQIWGKGVGYGTQSRLQFLPEHQTDFIFAAFAEEWGYIGVLLFFLLFGLIIWRIIINASLGATNFEMLFGLGLAIFLMAHFVIHVGMNIGILPITGLPVSFLSYGGSHMLTVFLGLGILMGMRRYSHAYHRDDVYNEFIGPR
ncbi:MAG: rod shape-determining protein RodA [Candidatus Vogelbacteria bacterium RIFOXYD1_FULL_44_32]|uniref:Rod shape-determining protein RodA n=1 Tax=Candidatus Vogelbacteria bacterium RIFOXYD1_FULL_44_32 TaxID=1802438 RepID=A0A1G2QEQ6_9BACT|nr:MAG: rod shape-determining protein RodA [Candidatus Vogelbacteria bacterium RIFOXYD1_FULL_44_32]